MKNLETTIIINSSTSEVWNKLVDFKAYNSWNPFIKSISGTAIEQESIEVVMQLKNKKPQTFKPVILKFAKDKEFRWIGSLGLKSIFSGEHYFKLERISNNKTKLIHGERFGGILSGLIMKMIGKETEIGFKEMNEAIKNELENK
jgi:hypothetical protein